MSRDEFFPLVERELRLRHIHLDGRALREFTETMAVLLLDDDSPQGWADTFLEVQGTEPGLRDLGGRPAAALVEPGVN
jgi:hypothetical protein